METILYIGGFELPDKNAAAHRVISNAKIFTSIGYEVVFLDIDRSQAGEKLQLRKDIIGCQRWSVPYNIKRLYSNSNVKKIVKNNQNISIIIAYNYPSIVLIKLFFFCKINNIILISDCTEWYGALGKTPIKRLIKGIDSYIRMNVIQPRVDGVIVISNYLEEFYKEKTWTIKLPPLVDRSDTKWNLDKYSMNKKVTFVYAGTPGKHKDKLDVVIESLYCLQSMEFNFFIIGITKEQFISYYPDCLKYLKKLENKVFFLGIVSHEEAIQIVVKADFTLFIRDINRVTMAGFPTKFSESISCGTPVITNESSDLSSYLVDGANGIVIRNDIKYTIQKILHMDKKSIATLRKNIDKDTFDYKRYIPVTNKWIESIKEEKGKSFHE